MYSEFLTDKQVVENALRDFPETRNSDKKLFLKVFERFGLYLTDDQKKRFLEMPACFESIRRMRQKIQNEEKKYLPDKQVIQFRKQEEESIRHVASQVNLSL